MYENPSADKFDPPAEPPPAVPRRSRNRRLILLLLLLFGYPFRHWLPPSNGRWWGVLILPGLALASGVLEYVLRIKHSDDFDGKDPYSHPPNITR